MVMTEDEIASAAARRSAARRKRVTKRCERCGTEFEGLTTKRYCSDRCRVEAARARGHRNGRSDRPDVPDGPPFDAGLTDDEIGPRPGEGAADFFERFLQTVYGDVVLDTDVVDDLRRADDELSQRYSAASRS